MNSWFSNRGQILQLLIAAIALIVGAINAWPSIRVLDLFSFAPIVFLLLIVAVVTYANWARRNSRELEGVEAVHLAWAATEDPEWVRSQSELYIFLKDGKSFFEERMKKHQERMRALASGNDDPIYDRLIDSRKTTHFLIVHPDFRHIEAVASMDPFKVAESGLQREDILAAVRTLQVLAAEARSNGMDITRRNTFLGYRLIPTYNAMLGDDRGHINLYYSRPYRGNLLSLDCQRLDSGGIYAEYKKDLTEIVRNKNTTSLWSFNLSNQQQ